MRRGMRSIERQSDRPVLITGGAGFIGTNLAARFMDAGRGVRVLDNLSRRGVDANLQWLQESYGSLVEIMIGDIRDIQTVTAAVDGVAEVYHLAAQVAVTSSLDDPRHDFSINAGGTLNLLETLRALPMPPPLVFTSTNKVYGDLEDIELVPEEQRYVPADAAIRAAGVSERRGIDFHSPYGCSKGAADQYVLDYARTFGIPAVVFRMSCIYGPHQCGSEDQGWVAHFVRRAVEREPLTIYGDGHQVRDVLYVDDLLNAFALAQEHMLSIAGEAFNIGGGPERAVSLRELVASLDEMVGDSLDVSYDAWRDADQRYYVSDCEKFRRATGWTPSVAVADGLRRLYAWLNTEQESGAELPAAS
jgi:CDP-paratose 2-epimerase